MGKTKMTYEEKLEANRVSNKKWRAKKKAAEEANGKVFKVKYTDQEKDLVKKFVRKRHLAYAAVGGLETNPKGKHGLGVPKNNVESMSDWVYTCTDSHKFSQVGREARKLVKALYKGGHSGGHSLKSISSRIAMEVRAYAAVYAAEHSVIALDEVDQDLPADE
ncbi:hypothetical protein JCM3775_007445 [Rhodotorula graminis]